jgi:hypothetical protein
MAQHDMNIANQSFPSFRTDLNNALSAINTMHSGTSRPSGAAAGTMWLDTTSASSPTIKFFDGSDDISFATIDYTANTVNFIDSTISLATPLAVAGNSTAGAEIRLPEDTDNGSNYIALKAADTIASNVTLTLPSADGTNGQALTTNGSGVLAFSDVSVSLGSVGESIIPSTTDTYDLGSTTKVWRNIYTGDLNLNNEAKGGNDIDGSTGSWTVQEGSEDLFLINRKSGKKYKFKLEEI